MYAEHADCLYADRDQTPVGDRQVRNYLEKLLEYQLIEKEGANRWAECRVVDEKLVAPAVDIAAVLN